MKCPECGAPLRLEEDKDYLVCDFCTSMHFPDPNADGVRVLGEPATEACPLCQVPLVHAAVGGMRILYCERCRGMLLPMAVFVALIDTLRSAVGHAVLHPPDPRDLERKIRCPRCHATMDTHPYAGPGAIVIDSCSRCQLDWLDHGELQRVLHAPGRE